MAMASTVLDWPDSGISSTSASKLLINRSIRYKEVAKVIAAISQGSPPAVSPRRGVDPRPRPERGLPG